MRTVVVTGITGKSGQFFLKRLISEKDKLCDYRFKLICRKQTNNAKNAVGYELIEKAIADKELDIELCTVDLKNADEVRSVFNEPVYMLMHIASVKMTMDIVPIALECGVDNIVMVHETILSFIFKGNTDSIWASREDIAANHIERFNISPIFGTGFMVPYSEGVLDFNFSFDLIVEPGNLITMLLGDTGLLGFVSFIVLLIAIITNGHKYKLYLIVGAILICMGEMVFFSPNNMAVLLYVLIGIYLFDGKTLLKKLS